MCKWEKMPEGHDYWDEIHAKLFNLSKHGTTDGKPWVEPELTDEDAKQRPWVMIRKHCGPEHGPYIFIRKRDCGVIRYICEGPGGGLHFASYARRATPEEIEAANAERQ
jgi:hypothetical protein